MAASKLSAATPRTDYQHHLEPARRRRKIALTTSLGIGAFPLLVVLYALAPTFDAQATLIALGAVMLLVLVITAATVAYAGQDVALGERLLRDGRLSSGEVVGTGAYASGQGTVDIRFTLPDGGERVTRFRLAASADDAARLAGKAVDVLALGNDGPFGVVLGELGIVTTR